MNKATWLKNGKNDTIILHGAGAVAIQELAKATDDRAAFKDIFSHINSFDADLVFRVFRGIQTQDNLVQEGVRLPARLVQFIPGTDTVILMGQSVPVFKLVAQNANRINNAYVYDLKKAYEVLK